MKKLKLIKLKSIQSISTQWGSETGSEWRSASKAHPCSAPRNKRQNQTTWSKGRERERGGEAANQCRGGGEVFPGLRGRCIFECRLKTGWDFESKDDKPSRQRGEPAAWDSGLQSPLKELSCAWLSRAAQLGPHDRTEEMRFPQFPRSLSLSRRLCSNIRKLAQIIHTIRQGTASPLESLIGTLSMKLFLIAFYKEDSSI